MWYFIVSIPDLCTLTYSHHRLLHKLNYYGVGESFFSSLSSKGSNLFCWMVPNVQKQMYCLKARKSRDQRTVPCGSLLSWPLLMTCQSPKITQMPDCLLTTAFSIDMLRQVKTKPSSRKIYQRWRDGKKPGG